MDDRTGQKEARNGRQDRPSKRAQHGQQDRPRRGRTTDGWITTTAGNSRPSLFYSLFISSLLPYYLLFHVFTRLELHVYKSVSIKSHLVVLTTSQLQILVMGKTT